MDEIERLKAENKKLREYADFKRDLKSKRTWLMIGPPLAVLVGFMVWDTQTGDSARRMGELLSITHMGVFLGITFGAIVAMFIFRIPDLVIWWRQRKA